MQYEFDTNKGIFTLYDPETGKDWSNHLFNDMGYCMSITHFGAPQSRYTNEKAETVALNCPLASFLYVRDAADKTYWNTAIYPSLHKTDAYRCEHGQSYTRISSKSESIFSQLTYAVAPNDTREVWQVVVRNESDRVRTIDLFAVTAFDLNGYGQPVYYSAVTSSATEYLPEANAVFCANKNPYRPHERASGYILSSEKSLAYEGNYENFIGTMGTQTKPVVLERGEDLQGGTATVRTRGGILQNRVLLKGGEEKTLYYVLGIASSETELKERYDEIVGACAGIISSALNGEKRFGRLRTECPEPQFNRVFNFWTEHQISYCICGGKKAVRDSAQWALAMLNFNTDLAKKTIDECLCHQYSDGHAVLTWYPYLEQNTYSDPSAWLVFAVCEYIKETGDVSYLDAVYPYLDGGKASVYEHLRRAADWFSEKENYGQRGLFKMFFADWNDALNIPDENAESVFTSLLVCKAFDDVYELFSFAGREKEAQAYKDRKEKLSEIINRVAYNGEYYVRAFSRFGIVGDKTCTGGKIYVNPQSWAILADVCPPERLQSVLAAIDGIETEDGIPLCSPAYATYDESVGRMSGMLAGVYENGGIYNHASCFKVMADCKAGRAGNAVATLKKIVPDGAHHPSSRSTTEPYVFTNCYLKHPSVDGKVGFSWQTGTSAWALRAYYEGILGIRRDYDGLHICPCFPSSWQKAQAWRHWRGNELHILYKRGKSAGVFVDGHPIVGDKIVPFADSDAHDITIVVEEKKS